MSLLTAAEYKAVVASDVESATLQEIIDAEEAEMIARFGAHGDGATAVTETYEVTGAELFVSRPATSITSVAVVAYVGATGTTLSTSQYYFVSPTNRIRLSPFLSAAFVTVVYVPASDQAIRRQILIDLVRLRLANAAAPAVEVSGLGYSIKRGASATQSYDERERLYSRIVPQAV